MRRFGLFYPCRGLCSMKYVLVKNYIEKQQPITQIKRPRYPIWITYLHVGKKLYSGSDRLRRSATASRHADEPVIVIYTDDDEEDEAANLESIPLPAAVPSVVLDDIPSPIPVGETSTETSTSEIQLPVEKKSDPPPLPANR